MRKVTLHEYEYSAQVLAPGHYARHGGTSTVQSLITLVLSSTEDDPQFLYLPIPTSLNVNLQPRALNSSGPSLPEQHQALTENPAIPAANNKIPSELRAQQSVDPWILISTTALALPLNFCGRRAMTQKPDRMSQRNILRGSTSAPSSATASISTAGVSARVDGVYCQHLMEVREID